MHTICSACSESGNGPNGERMGGIDIHVSHRRRWALPMLATGDTRDARHATEANNTQFGPKFDILTAE